jgi:uroporphyrinogen-III synthase
MSAIKILCTRPADGAEEFKRILETSGAVVITVPMIEIYPVADQSLLDSKLDILQKYDGIIFTSSNGVKIFFKRAGERGIHIKNKIYAVGEKTKKAIEDSGYKVSMIPDSYDSVSLAKLLASGGGENLKYLFPSGNLSMKSIVSGLKNVDEIVVYETRKPLINQSFIELERSFKNNEIDCIAFFSPSAVSNFAELFPDYRNINADIAVIGKTTAARAEEIGLIANITAKKATGGNLGEEIINYYNAG